MSAFMRKVIFIGLTLGIIGTVFLVYVASIKDNGDKGQKEQQKVGIIMSESNVVTGSTVKQYISQAIQTGSTLTVTYTNTGGTAVSKAAGGTMPTDVKDKSLYTISKTFDANGELSTVTFAQKDLSK